MGGASAVLYGIGVGRWFSLMGPRQNLLNAKAVCGQIKCLHTANFVGVTAPIAPMVPMPMNYYTRAGGLDRITCGAKFARSAVLVLYEAP